jgi:hypothetical protein
MTEINSKMDIVSALKDSEHRARNWFSAIPNHEFFTRQGEVWSSSDNVDHMIRAIKPLIKALKLPKVALQTMFGRPGNLSRTYDEICTIYRGEIANGARASGTFLPKQNTPQFPEQEKEELLDKLSSVIDKLTSVLEGWSESDLDEVQLPHPIIGKLTVREMLFFTIYHNLRHASREGD